VRGFEYSSGILRAIVSFENRGEVDVEILGVNLTIWLNGEVLARANFTGRLLLARGQASEVELYVLFGESSARGLVERYARAGDVRTRLVCNVRAKAFSSTVLVDFSQLVDLGKAIGEFVDEALRRARAEVLCEGGAESSC